MHGVKRQSRSAIEARKAKEKSQLETLLSLTDDVLQKKRDRDYSQSSFDLTTRLLHINPEFYTVWNYRRAILVQGLFPQCQPEEVFNILVSELFFTMQALQAHPKVYWIWNHRRWCLEHIPDGPGAPSLESAQQDADSNDPSADPTGWRKRCWTEEMRAVEKMLDKDARNFHAWAYRRYVLAQSPISRPLSSELAYTLRKIEANFSNFSAWHQRSKIYTEIWKTATKAEVLKAKESEFDLVRNAMYTDPEDQSVWMYHRWLVGSGDDPELLRREISVIQELLDEQPDSKWCMESLVHYKRLLIKNCNSNVDRGQQDTRPSESATLAKECLSLLMQLHSVDPARRQRYSDTAKEVEASLATLGGQ